VCSIQDVWKERGIGRRGEGKGMIVVDVEVVMNFSPNYP
jgi:hypothetical protein